MDAILNKKKIVDFVAHFSEIAKRDNWISHYDADSDSLAVRVPHLSEDARKKYVNDEFAFYLTPKSDVEGIFIEYFLSNFVSHHADFKDMAKELKRDAKADGSVVTLDKNEMKKMVPELQEAILNSLIPSREMEQERS